MNVVTLTTDFGWRDYYVGVIKGGILSHQIPVVFADISHEIEPYNIVQAAYILKNSYSSFPKGSIHLVSVNVFYTNRPKFLIVEYDGHYFIGPDNGIFSLMFDQPMTAIHELNQVLTSAVFSVKDAFALAVGQLLKGAALQQISQPAQQVLQRLSLQPITGKDQIRGSVIHIDHYQNVVLNIDRPLFERIRQKRDFELYFKRYDPITCISENYADVPIGEVLCLFNTAGFLEIAVNMDKAATLFGLEVDEAIQIDFIIPPID